MFKISKKLNYLNQMWIKLNKSEDMKNKVNNKTKN